MKSQETFACPRGPGDERFTSLSGSGIGTLRSRIWSNSEKIAALAPMPRPNDRIAIIVTNGFLKRLRTANLRFIYSITACTTVSLTSSIRFTVPKLKETDRARRRVRLASAVQDIARSASEQSRV